MLPAAELEFRSMLAPACKFAWIPACASLTKKQAWLLSSRTQHKWQSTSRDSDTLNFEGHTSCCRFVTCRVQARPNPRLFLPPG